MRYNSLPEWLSWQESLNPKEIDLGLDRVEQVLFKLDLCTDFRCPVITVAGTNGKGSSVAMLESILLASNYRVGCYTSPHLFNYNERIHLNGKNISDADLCAAFEQVDQARGDIPLTYFEFGTLAALLIFAQSKLDIVILEVGLGGRLDAVNVINPDIALITSVDVDHCDWLGDDIETIAREKAGIMRSNRPVIYGGLKLPESIKVIASEKQARLLVAGSDYLYQGIGERLWQLKGPDINYPDLPMPALSGNFQLQNAAAVIVTLNQLSSRLPVTEAAIASGLQNVSLAGRFQQIQSSPSVIVDVAHNAQAARALAEMLAEKAVAGKTLAVVAMLADKAVDEVVAILDPVIDEWFSAGLALPRGRDADSMAKAVNALSSGVKLSSQNTVAEACEQAVQHAGENDQIIIFGSFYTVNQACDYFLRD